MFPQLPAVLGMATSGAVKPLAVTSSYRLEQLPDLPTLSETVLPNFHVASWNMLFGPRGLPDDDPQDLERCAGRGGRRRRSSASACATIGVAPVGKPSAEADAFFEQELIRWKHVIDVAGIKLER